MVLLNATIEPPKPPHREWDLFQVGANRWDTAQFDDLEERNKFQRLMVTASSCRPHPLYVFSMMQMYTACHEVEVLNCGQRNLQNMSWGRRACSIWVRSSAIHAASHRPVQNDGTRCVSQNAHVCC